jgi:hypothetical protein
MSVRAPLLVAICLSALSAAQAEQARMFRASIDVITSPQRGNMNGRSGREVCPSQALAPSVPRTSADTRRS